MNRAVRVALALAACAGGMGAAQTRSVSLEEAVKLIARSQSTLRIYAPTMQNPDVTAAYRQAIVRRVLAVIVTTPDAVHQGERNERVVQVAFAGYDTQSAQLYAPKILNAAASVPFVVVDDAFALIGQNLTRVPLPGDPVTVQFTRDPKVVAALVTWVKANAKAAKPVDLKQWLSSRISR
ncbi:hypothetical protein [Deinococcus sp. PEB2-63]